MRAGDSGAVAVHMQQQGAVDAICELPPECGSAPLEPVFVGVVSVVVSAVLVAGVIVYTRRAQSLVTEEHERTRAEQEAFSAFIEEVEDIAVETGNLHPQSGPAGGIQIQNTASSAATTTAAGEVQTAYRETVMGVDHYDEYDESLGENMRAEFGPEVTTAVLTEQRFTPQVKQALIQNAHAARRQRDDLLEILARERTALADAEEIMADAEAAVADTEDEQLLRWSFDDLVDRWEQLRRLEQACEEVVEERQEQLHTGHGVGGDDPEGLFGYVYESLSVRYPVLADATATIASLRDTRSTVSNSLSRIV